MASWELEVLEELVTCGKYCRKEIEDLVFDVVLCVKLVQIHIPTYVCL